MAITLLPIDVQDQLRYKVAHNIERLYKQQSSQKQHINIWAKNEKITINQIKKKLVDNKAMISKADKGNSIIITHIDYYKSKIMDFITNNNFIVADNDITKKLQYDLRHTINECQQLICKGARWRYTNFNPTAPALRGLLKIHKEDNPIRNNVNWKNAPAYKLAKILTKKLVSNIPLPYTFNISNTVQLLNDLIDIPYDSSIKFASFDLTNMYSNIPTKELLRIINTICEEQGMCEQTKQEIIKLSQILVEQNYFRFHDTTYIQQEGLAMGAPTSSIFS